MQRRSFLGGVAAFLAAPAIIRVADLMPISVHAPVIIPPEVARGILTPAEVTREALRILHKKMMLLDIHMLDRAHYTPILENNGLRIRLPAQYTVRA